MNKPARSLISGINHITFSVHDLDKAFTFYCDVLGLCPIMKSGHSAYFTAGPTWIALVAEPDKQRPDDRYTHVAFAVPKPDFAAMATRLQTAEAPVWQANQTEGDSLYFCDPSGNRLEIHANTLEDRIADGKRNWGPDIRWFR